MDRTYLLGADIGTTAIKVALFDSEGNKVIHHSKEYELIKPDAKRVEQKPSVYYDTFKMCVKEVIKKSGIDSNLIKGFAMDSSAETIVFLDENMNPLDNFYTWLDSRAEEEANEINARFTPEEILMVTGQLPIDTVYPATKILWFKKNKPELFKKIAMMFMCDDYILYQMCKKKVGHGSSWCTSYLWDITKKIWWKDMLDYLEINENQLPEICECGDVIGTIDDDVADELGLPRNLKLVMGGQDQCSGAIGVGNVEPGIFSESTGGALMVCTTSSKPIFDKSYCIPCNYSDMKDIYMLQAGAKGGIMLRWLRDTLCLEELRLEKSGEGNAYDLMDKLAKDTPPGAEGLFLMPFFGGAGCPNPDLYGRACLYGLSLGHTKGHIIRAFMEALAINVALMCDYIEELTGVKVTQVRCLGGGSLSPLWCQIKADILNRQVVTMKNTQDAACLGAAITAGYGIGIYSSIQDTAKKFAKIDKVYNPNPENREVYDCLILKYKTFIEATKGYTKELSRIK